LTNHPNKWVTYKKDVIARAYFNLDAPCSLHRSSSLNPSPKRQITRLFLAANPKHTNPLRLGEEVRTIDERVRLARQRDRFSLEQQ
jgi:hypothetical protein